jgi:ankyrin repeat protein
MEERSTYMKILSKLIAALALIAWVLCSAPTVQAGEIHQAAQKGNLKKVEAYLLENPELLNVGDLQEGRTPLHWAALGGSAEVASFLISKGAQIQARDKDGQTPIHLVITEEIARMLIKRGGDVTSKDNYGRMPLHYAAYYGREKMIDFFLASGSLINALDEEANTPLLWALNNGQKAAAVLLIEKGANVSAAAKDGTTPLKVAKKKGFRDIVDLLQKRNAQE